MTASDPTAGSGFVPLAPGFDADGLIGYRDGVLSVDGVSAEALAKSFGTPAYVFAQRAAEQAYDRLEQALAAAMPQERAHRICYAVKANTNRALLRALALRGAGADVVSIGEVKLALSAGFKAADIVFSGVGKSPAEIAEAIALGVGQFNAESEAEIDLIDGIARSSQAKARLALRVNPDVDAGTHTKISTGRKGDKFGIPYDRIVEAYVHAANLPNIEAAGLAVHIGSQITTAAPFHSAFAKIATAVRAIRDAGADIHHLDLGGGLGIRYKEEMAINPADWAEAVAGIAAPLACDVTVEPGRYIVGPAGLLLASVLYVKDTGDRQIVVLDASMTELIRPSLYSAWHEVIPLRAPAEGTSFAPVDLVGPVCESGDTFAQHRLMPPLAVGDRVAFLTAGAYANVMASNYNARPLPPEIVVSEGRQHLVRQRQEIAELIERDTLPGWL
jgi:diaminopimelate decarboxylase